MKPSKPLPHHPLIYVSKASSPRVRNPTTRGLLIGSLVCIAVAWILTAGVVESLSLRELAPTARVVPAMLLVVEVVLALFGAALLLAAIPGRPQVPAPLDACLMPDVDLLVPVKDEDPRVLARTLESIARLDVAAARLRVLVVDDSVDASNLAENARLAKLHGAEHVTRCRRGGYKAGALNDALLHCTAAYVGVLDVDHAPDALWLRRALPSLDEARVACVQSRIAWRNAEGGIRPLAALLQDQFYGVIQYDRGARDAAVFAGSAAVFRRRALDDVGGFPEETLVEDFDLTVLLQTRGWRMRYDDRVGATGLLPWHGLDVARQLWRWSAGTTRVLRLRTGHILRAPLPLRHRLELLAAASSYLTGGTFVLVGILLLAHLLVGGGTTTPLGVPLALLAPALVLVAHVGTAALAARRAGRRAGWLLLPYHIVTLAFTPILFASTLTALARHTASDAGRVTKDPDAARHRHARGFPAVAGITAIFGASLAAAGMLLLPQGGAAGIWAVELGIAFVLPAILWWGPVRRRAASAT